MPTPTKIERSLPIPVIIVALFLAVAGGGLWLMQKYSSGPAEPAPITAEAKAYAKNLKLAEVEMKAHESFAKQELVEITGKITNAGDRPLRQVTLNCVFSDPYNQVVLRQRVAIVKSTGGPLQPGDTRNFRLPFDEVPATWSKAMPQLVIAEILF